MKLEEIKEEIQKLQNYTRLLGSPDEFFRHMNGHSTELSLVLSAFTLAEESETIMSALEMQISKLVEIKEWCPADCPHCKYELSEHHGDGYYTYPTHLDMCPMCGQKIRWDN